VALRRDDLQGSWQAGEQGGGQLHKLNSMVRTQEKASWTALGLVTVANAVLVFSYFQQEEHFLARSVISLVALAVNGALFAMLMEARGHQSMLKKKALALESDLGVPQEFRIWGEAPEGKLMTMIRPATAAALLIYWAVCLVYAAISFMA